MLVIDKVPHQAPRGVVSSLTGLESSNQRLPSTPLACGVASCWAILIPSRKRDSGIVVRALMPVYESE